MEEKGSWKNLIIGAVIFLVVSAAAIAVMALWPEGEEAVTVAGPAGPAEASVVTVEKPQPLSHDELVAKALEVVRPYLPGAATLNTIDPNIEAHGAGGAFGVKDPDGTDLGMVIVDSQGKLTSLTIFYEGDASRLGAVSLEEAERITLDFIEGWGIDTSSLVQTESYTHNVSESQREHNLSYSTHIDGIPVEGAGNCSFQVSSIDGRIVHFYIKGDFMPPGVKPTEVRVDEEEARSLAMEMFERDSKESGEYVPYLKQDITEAEVRVQEPVEFVYVQDWHEDGGITPVWRVEMTYIVTTEHGGREYSNVVRHCIYQVDATTGEVLNFAGFM